MRGRRDFAARTFAGRCPLTVNGENFPVNKLLIILISSTLVCVTYVRFVE